MNTSINKSTLIEKVAHFRDTGEGFCSLVDELGLRIYHYPLKKHGASLDDCGEFYLYFMPRLKNIARNFKENGKPFEIYFNSILFWSYKTYIKQQIKESNYRRCCKSIDLCETGIGNDSIGSILDSLMHNRRLSSLFLFDSHGRIHDQAGKKRLLIFLLKQVKDITCQDIVRISEITGYDACWLSDIVEYLKKTLAAKFRRLSKFRERRNRAYWRLLHQEYQLSNQTDEAGKMYYRQAIGQTKESMKIAIDTIARIQLTPSQWQIAKALKLPKGTVDSAIIKMQKKLSRVYQEDEKQYA